MIYTNHCGNSLQALTPVIFDRLFSRWTYYAGGQLQGIRDLLCPGRVASGDSFGNGYTVELESAASVPAHRAVF